jgi:heptosyltransferase-1
VVKLTSMGDALHLLPALSDFQARYPAATVDWMIEDSFSEIPEWHASVERVIAVSTRRWRSLNLSNLREFWAFWKLLRARRYDYIIDAQGLMKSAIFARFAKITKAGQRVGFSADSIKESPAARLYTRQIRVAREQHAIDRLRQLFCEAFAYTLPTSAAYYSIHLYGAHKTTAREKTILFFPSTTWASKHIPEQIWRQLADQAVSAGYQVKISWGSDKEHIRATRISANQPNVTVMPRSTLTELLQALLASSGVIAVDTGLGHMAAAASVPAVSIYGATDARLTGAVGLNQLHLQTTYACSPCFLKQCNKLSDQVLSPPCYDTLSAADIWQALVQQIT